MQKYNQVILLLIMLCFCPILFSQVASDLKKEKEKIKNDINLMETLIDETIKKKTESVNELNLIEGKIELRRDYIININKEIEIIEKEINNNVELIESLYKELNDIKIEYARLIYEAYKNRRKENILLYVLASDNFNQAYKRIKYTQLYTEYKNRQIKLIDAFKKVLIKKNDELVAQKLLKESLLNNRENELNSITKEQEKKKRLLIVLRKREKELLKEIDEKKKMAIKIENEIAKIINAEKTKLGGKNIYERLTPEEKVLSNNFQLNKGKLPWPTSKGIISGRFGIQQHPVLKNIKIKNDGIYITTVENGEARAVFNGEVSGVFPLPGSNFSVLIKHGNFFTLYNNLIEVFVKKGDKVVTKQRIGKIFSDKDKNETVLSFQIWNEMERNDPEIWLSR